MEFEDRHGGRDKAVVLADFVYYPDGAVRENRGVLAGFELEPPDDQRKRALRILRYREELLRRAVRDFHKVKDDLLEQAQHPLGSLYSPAAPDRKEAVAALKRHQATVLQRQREVEEIRQYLYGRTPEQLEMEAAADRNHAANHEFVKTLKAIEV